MTKCIATLLVVSISIASSLAGAQAADGRAEVRDHRSNPIVRDHRSKPIIRDHRTTRKNEVVPSKQKKYSCASGSERLVRMGYTSISAYDCNGSVYYYTAIEGASIFRASMKAFTGKMTVQFIALAN